ncbi:MAG: hypothetical protein ABJH05_02180 [Fulvivirga sp.]
MATITIYLTYQSPNLMWRNDPSEEWKVMEETSVTADTSAGDTVKWVHDDTIRKIVNIKVGRKNKTSTPGYKWKDIWSQKPKNQNDFVGIVSSSMHEGDTDGYDITVQTVADGNVTVDPGVDVTKPPKE